MGEMTIEELIKFISDNQKSKDTAEKQIKYLQEQIAKLDEEIEDKKCLLLAKLDEEQVVEKESDGLVATIFEKEDVGYTSDNDVIAYLKQNCQSDYIKVKTTESIDKNALKKALKTNEDLAKDLEQFIIKTTTRYVVVTTQENHQKMLEHIEIGKSNK